MNRLIELHDSVVAEIRVSEGTVIVRFGPAYVHESTGRPGIDAGTGWSQDATLIIREATLSGRMPQLPHGLHDGEMVVDGHEMLNEIPLPLETDGNVKLVAVFALLDEAGEGFSIEVVGKGCRIELGSDATYVEEFRP